MTYTIFNAQLTAADLPPQYFEPTANDLRATQASLSARAAALRDAPLLTQKLREEKQKEKIGRFPVVSVCDELLILFSFKIYDFVFI